MRFMDKRHEERFNELIERGKISFNDEERKIVMFLIAGNDALYRKADRLYDFSKNQFIFSKNNGEIEWEVPMSSSEEKMITLAYDLYSASNNVTVNRLFRVLDSYNTRLALNTIAEAYLF